MALFSDVALAPRDPILGLADVFKADPNPNKVDLTIGVYTDEAGKIPVLKSVARVQDQLAQEHQPKGYLPIDGLASYNRHVQALYFGAHEAVSSGRIATVQSLGGTGALKLGADFLYTLVPDAAVLISDPTWANHHAIFKGAGFKNVGTYPYYDAIAKGVKFDALMEALRQARPNSIVVLHACCHNPTGYDMTSEQWDAVLAVVQKNGLIPFLDIAYQGFGDGFEQDGFVVQKLLALGVNFFAASSFSKIFSMYGERIGALSVVCDTQDEAQRVLSQIKQLVRSNYSNPPTCAAQIISVVLDDVALRQQWLLELDDMCQRVRLLRESLVSKLEGVGVQMDMGFIGKQKGMFSYTGLTKEQMLRIRSEFGIYGTDAGRICVASLNAGNLDYVAASIAKVVNSSGV